MQPAKRRVAFGTAAILAIAAVVAFATPHAAQAATKLPMVCTDPAQAGKPVNATCGGREQTGQIYRTPTATDLVRVMTDGRTVADWDSNAYSWAQFATLPAGRLYDVCLDDIPENAAVPGGPCQNWGMVPKAAAPATFTASKVTGQAPLSTVLTWSIPGGTNCAAGGVWQGAKASNGSETISVVANGTASLTCSVPGPLSAGSSTMTWTAPTQNTDGTPYTNPKGYFVYRGPTDPPTTKSPLIDKATLSFRVTDVPPGVLQWYAITAVNTSDVESDLTKTSVTHPGIPSTLTYSAQPISFTVTSPVKKPKAPTLSITFDP